MPSIEEIQRHECASFLFDGGWRSGDAAQLIEEYGITSEEAEKICEILAQFEEGEQ